jgi:hypothetical protein
MRPTCILLHKLSFSRELDHTAISQAFVARAEDKLLLQAAVLIAVLALSRIFYLQKYLLFARSVR